MSCLKVHSLNDFIRNVILKTLLVVGMVVSQAGVSVSSVHHIHITYQAEYTRYYQHIHNIIEIFILIKTISHYCNFKQLMQRMK